MVGYTRSNSDEHHHYSHKLKKHPVPRHRKPLHTSGGKQESAHRNLCPFPFFGNPARGKQPLYFYFRSWKNLPATSYLKIFIILIDALIRVQVMPSEHNFKQNYKHLNIFIIFTRQKYHL